MRKTNLLRYFYLKKTRILCFASQMINLQNETFLNGLDKLNEHKVNKIKSSNIVSVFLFVSVKDKNSCSIYARLTNSKGT